MVRVRVRVGSQMLCFLGAFWGAAISAVNPILFSALIVYTHKINFRSEKIAMGFVFTIDLDFIVIFIRIQNFKILS